MRFAGTELSEIIEFARDNPLAVLSTVTPDGRSESGLANVAVLDVGEIIANCRADARKVVNIRNNPAVSLVIGTTGDVSIQIEGNAIVARGVQRDEAIQAYRARFPESRAGNAGIEMIVISPKWFRIYDTSGAEPTSTEHAWPAAN